MKRMLRPLLILLILLGISWFYLAGGQEHLSFENVQQRLHFIQSLYEQRPLLITILFCTLYILITSLSIPGAIVLTVLAGSIFGVAMGTVLVSLASGTGATVAFLMARFLFRDSVERRFHKMSRKINRKVTERGSWYLLGLRLFPASPYVVINMVMGLTTMSAWTFTWITILGMLPGTFIYVYAGRKFAELERLSDIMTWPLVLALLTLSLLPYLSKLTRKMKSWNGMQPAKKR